MTAFIKLWSFYPAICHTNEYIYVTKMDAFTVIMTQFYGTNKPVLYSGMHSCSLDEGSSFNSVIVLTYTTPIL